MNFTLKDYAALIECMRKNGYTITDYTEYKKYHKAVIIKHDVDMSLEKAAEFAEFEKSLGIRTIYNVLLCSDFYNPYSKKNMGYLKQIIAAGHDIGLHFDEVRYEEHILENIDRELELLENFVGVQVKSMSMHRPSSQTLEANYLIGGGRIVNSYSKEFFKEFKYISDSRMNWREDPFETVECGKYDRLHLLTHPIWYTDDEEKNISEILGAFVKSALPERYHALEDNIRDLQSVLKSEE